MEDESPQEFADEDFLDVRIDNVSISNLGFIVFLRHGTDSRVLPIFIGSNEAHSIALALNGQASPRPMTHDLMKIMLEDLGWTVAKIQVTHLEENTFFGCIFLEHDLLPPRHFDARPSDAIALALRFQSLIHVHRKVYEQASVPMAAEATAESENELTEITPKEPSLRASPVEDLRIRLKKAVQEERYEEAAKLRDALRKLQAEN